MVVVLGVVVLEAFSLSELGRLSWMDWRSLTAAWRVARSLADDDDDDDILTVL